MVNKLILSTLLIFFNAFSLVHAQSDSTTKKKIIKFDTVHIYKEPVFIKKTVIVKELAVKDIGKKWLFDLFFSTPYTINNFSYCPCAYDSIYKKAFSSKISYNFGVNISRKLGKFIFTTSVNFLVIRNNISYDSIVVPNTTSYLNIGLLGGYIITKGRWTFIPSAGPVFSILTTQAGSTLSYPGLKWETLKSATFYYRHTIDITSRLRVMYKITDRFSIYLEPFFLSDMQNLTFPKIPFSLSRTSIGSNLGISIN